MIVPIANFAFMIGSLRAYSRDHAIIWIREFKWVLSCRLRAEL